MLQFITHNSKTIIWTFIVVVVCIIPGNEIPSPPILNLPHLDKLVHGGLYFVLTFLAIHSFSKQEWINKLKQSPFLFAFIYAVSLGIIIEFIQANFIPNRNGDIFDALANTTGSLLAVFVVKKLKLFHK